MKFKLRKFAPQKGKNREAGECDVLLNVTPRRVFDAECTRYGYSEPDDAPTIPTVGGTPVTVDHWRYVETDNPSRKGIWVCFGHISSNYYIFVSSYVVAGAWVDEWLQLNESASGTLRANCTTNTFDLNGSVSVTDDYYNGWVAFNTDPADGKKYSFVKDIDLINGNGNTFTKL